RPRRWGAARASACSTSTPTGIARGSCSSSSASGRRCMSTEVATTPAVPASQLAALKRVAIVPAYNEELNIVRVLSELRAFAPGLDIVVVSDGSTDPTAEVA